MWGARDTQWIQTMIGQVREETVTAQMSSAMAEVRTAWVQSHEDATQERKKQPSWKKLASTEYQVQLQKSLFHMSVWESCEGGSPTTLTWGRWDYTAPLTTPLPSGCTHWVAFGSGPSLSMKCRHLESCLMDMRVGMGAGAQWKQGSSQEYLSLWDKRKTHRWGKNDGRRHSQRQGLEWKVRYSMGLHASPSCIPKAHEYTSSSGKERLCGRTEGTIALAVQTHFKRNPWARVAPARRKAISSWAGKQAMVEGQQGLVPYHKGWPRGLSASGWTTDDSIRVTSISSAKWQRLKYKHIQNSMANTCKGGVEPAVRWSSTGSPGQTPDATGNGARTEGPRSGRGGEMAEGQAAVNALCDILPL